MIPPLFVRATNKPDPLSLMRLTQINDPDEVLKDHSRDDIVLEEKFDGWKVQVIKSDGDLHLYSRRGQEVTKNFPEIVEVMKDLPDGTLVEGELVYWDGKKQDVGKMTSLANSGVEKSRKLAKELPGEIRFHAYDILWKGGSKITEKPFSERRKALESVIKESDNVKITKQYPFSDWQKVMNAAVDSGGEGIVLKLKDAKYSYAPLGKQEPKPSDTMWKYKGGGGKTDSDDYVVYATSTGEKGKLKAVFGQNYKGKLYHISELSNFSSEQENEIKKRLKKGPFVIEIGFQERVPKGLRHQKFLRFRDDKKPKDATMHEFHVKNISELDSAKKEASVMKSEAAVVPRPEDLLNLFENTNKNKGKKWKGRVRAQDYSVLKPVRGVDIKKAYKLIAHLESNNTFVVGDSKTSFGPVQVQFGSFLRALAADPQTKALTGMSSQEMRRLASAWSRAYRTMRKIGSRIFKHVFVDDEAVRRTMKNRRRVVRRREGTTVRHAPGGQPGIVKVRDGKFIGYAIDLDALRSVGLKITPEIMAELHRITGQYITGAIVRNAIARLLAEQQSRDIYRKFITTFTRRNVQSNQALRNLADRAAQRNFMVRVSSVMSDIRRYGYDTTVPGAYNAYQLIAIANGSGIGRVRQFLRDKKLFGAGHLHYLQRANKYFSKEGIPSSFPPRGGIAGFQSATKEARVAAIVSFAAEPVPKYPLGGLAGSIVHTIHRYLNMEKISRDEWETLPVAMISIHRDPPKAVVVLKTKKESDQFEELRNLLPDKIQGLDIKYIGLPTILSKEEEEKYVDKPINEFREEPTVADPLSRLPMSFFQRYIYILHKAKEAFLDMGRVIPEADLKRAVVERVAIEHNMSNEDMKNMLGMTIDEFVAKAHNNHLPLFKRSGMPLGLSFPGQFAEDIKSGKRTFTIRPGDMPFRPDEVVQAMSYSGSPICRIRIISKEIMSLKRIEKAFGARTAQSLEKRFGANRRFVVIRFERFDLNEADDGEDEKKMSEVLIDVNGKSLTRGKIKAHYSKPSVRKSIMARIKGKPVLVYIGVGKNKKILKRNHDDKEIVIDNDDQSGSDNPSNYWYWVNRRVLSFHEVLGNKTDRGFVDLDLHGGYSLDKAKEYARKLVPAIKKEFGVPATIYESGGTGLHVEFSLKEVESVDVLRKRLKDLLDKLNEDFEGATTKIVKGKGLRTDVSTLHNKGSLRVPGSLGESEGKVKKKIVKQDTDDNYGNSDFGQKHLSDGPEPSGREGVLSLRPPTFMAPDIGGGWNASDDGGETRWWESDGDAVAAFAYRKELFRKAGDGDVSQN